MSPGLPAPPCEALRSISQAGRPAVHVFSQASERSWVLSAGTTEIRKHRFQVFLGGRPSA